MITEFYDQQSTDDTYSQFARILELTGPVGGIIEVGSWTGESAIRWLGAHKETFGKPCEIICVDSWKPYASLTGSKRADEMRQRLEQGRVFHRFIDRVEAAGYSQYVHPLRMDSCRIREILRPKQAALVYIDGAHDHISVYRDIQQARYLVQPGGIICGDDYDVPPNRLGLYAEEERLRDNVNGLHPGITHALIEAFGLGHWKAFNRLWWWRGN